MKTYSSPAARRVSRAALSALFTLALLVGALAPLASQVEAKSAPKSKKRSRVAATTKRGAKARRAPRRERADAEAEELEKYDEPSAGEDGDDNAEKREEWFRLQREYPSGSVPPDARRRAWASRPLGHPKGDEGRGILSIDATQWTPIGPAPSTPKFPNNWGITSGRINAIAVNPQNASVVLVGASTGGIWRSTDGGTSFAPASDSQVDLSVGSIAFAPSNPSIVYAGMGDIGNGYLGTGVLKSTDGGASWTRVSQVLGTDCASLPAFNAVGCLPAPAAAMNVLVDPNDPNRVYLTQYNYVNTSTNGGFASGFFVSTDGGATWRRTLSGLPRDLVMHPTNPSILYLAMRRVDTGQQLPGLYKSTDSGLTWARVYDSPYDSAYAGTATLRDIRVAVTPAAPNNVYVFAGKTVSPANVRVNVSTDGGATWDTTTTSNVDPGQFGYNAYIAVDPSNPNTIYVATRDVYKSTDGGANWTGVTKNFSGSNFGYIPSNSTSHPDQHCFAFSPGNPQTFYIGNDGGISKTTTGGTGPNPFTSLNASLSLSQFVGVVSHPTNPNFQIGGTQDNGTQVRLAAGSGVGWTEFAEGDGGHPVINPVDPRAVLSTYVYGRIRRWQFNADGTRSEKGGTASESTFGESDTTRFAFYPPFTGNGVDAAVYFGTWRLFVSQNFADTVNTFAPTWNSPGGTSDQTKGGLADCTISPKPFECTDVLTAVGVPRTPYSASQVIYTGSAQGRVMISTDGGATWTDRTSNLPNRFIEGITVADGDPSGATAYVVAGGYGTGHVWKTTNSGVTWNDLSGTNPATKLPNTPTTALLVDPSNPSVLYAGTDIGVFRSISGGNTWETFNNGLPPVPVNSFSVSASGKIQIGTYGRGAYELQTSAGLSTLQFELQLATVGEATSRAVLNVTRTGDLSGAVSATARTQDNQAAVRCDDTTTLPFVAFARCDYATTVETLTFAPGETVKSFSVSIINDVFKEPDENVSIALVNPSAGAQVGPQGTLTLRIVSDDAATPPASLNPIVSPDFSFFVRQQYLDFFGREPDAGGFQAWKGTLDNCPNPFNSSPSSPSANCDRVSVSKNFFLSAEFEQKGRFVFNFYKAALARLPHYNEFIPDISSLIAVDNAGFFAKRAAFTNDFVQRQEFRNIYDPLSNQQYVDTLMGRYNLQQVTTADPSNPDDTTQPKVTLTRTNLVSRLNLGTMTRAQVLRAIASSDQVAAAEANSSFVAMQYFGYLRRDPEEGGYNNWLATINANPADIRSMVNGFMNSEEYRLRFGTP